MKAMILAAGLGTRLRPLTNDRPKALVEVAGRTLLELAVTRLRSAGVREVVINIHHFADMILQYLEDKNNFGIRIDVSREEALLDTGGGLNKAAPFFLEENPALPFIVHNVDVISTIDLGRMMHFHLEHDALATIAVHDRNTSRPLVFGENGQFLGRQNKIHADAEVRTIGSEQDPSVHPAPRPRVSGFSGIHIVSPRIFAKIREEGAFSIIDSYIRLASQGERIVAFPADEYYWRDLGTPENVAQAARDMENGTYPCP
jgi:NDP-sugar pyrophosphorylase family protein